jgi:hypothetical protein
MMVSTVLYPGLSLTGYDYTWFRSDGLGTFYTISDENGYFRYKYGTVCSKNDTVDIHHVTQEYGEENIGCVLGLSEGTYMFRVTGAEDPHHQSVQWEFCNTHGDAQNELIFSIGEGGECTSNGLRNVSEVCNPEESNIDINVKLKPKPKPIPKPLNNVVGNMSVVGTIHVHINSNNLTNLYDNVTQSDLPSILKNVLLNTFRNIISTKNIQDNTISIVSMIQKGESMKPTQDASRTLAAHSDFINGEMVQEITFELSVPMDLYDKDVSIANELQLLENDLRAYIMMSMESGLMLSQIRSMAKQSHSNSLQSISSISLLNLEVRHVTHSNRVVSDVANGIIIGVGIFSGIFIGIILSWFFTKNNDVYRNYIKVNT